MQQQLHSPPSQSSTLKLGSDNRKPYQTPPLLYDALNRHDISRYDPLPLNMNYGGSNSTLSSGGSAGNASIANGSAAATTILANGHFTSHHHTLPHASSTIQQATQKLSSIADYLTASSLIDYSLSKTGTGVLEAPTNSVLHGSTILHNTLPSTANAMGHMTLPKSLALESIISTNGGGGCPVGIAPTQSSSSVTTLATPSSSSNLLAVTQKTNANRNHIITDTLPGPESCV